MNFMFSGRLSRFLSPLLGWVFLLSPAVARTDAATVLSFGRVAPGAEVAEVITFRNPTDALLEIKEIKLTAPLLARNISSVIPPGMEGSFELVLGPDRAFGSFMGTVNISFKNAAHPDIVFEVEGFIIPPIEFQPFPAFFVATHHGKDRTASIEILNHREEPLLLAPVESKNDRYELMLATIEAGQHYRLSLTLDGDAEPGEQQDEIFLQADPPLDEPLKVQVNTKIRARVYHFPDSVDMGSLPLKVAKDDEMVKKLSQILMVYRPETDDFEAEAAIDLDYVGLVGERGPEGDRYQFTLTLEPAKVQPGKIEGTVTIKTNDPEFPTLQVPLSGYILE